MIKHAGYSALFVILLSACAGDVADDEALAGEDEVVGEAKDAIVQAVTTPSFAGTVAIGNCTGTVLSEHWVLTAAHCLYQSPPEGDMMISAAFGTAPNTSFETIYSGPVRRHVHPNYVYGKRPYDVGLVQLLSYGINTTPTGRAKLYSGSSTAPPSNNMIVAGFGPGTDVGGSSVCPPGADGKLRYRGQTVTTSNSTVMCTADRVHCPGDSGGPWLTQLWSGSSYSYIEFAVFGGWGAGTTENAANIKSTRPWIESTMANNLPYLFGLSYSPGSVAGVPYVSYNEAGFNLTAIKLGNWCVEPDGQANASRAVLRACNGSASQQWLLKATGEIRHPVSNLCLSGSAGGEANGTAVQIWQCYDQQAYRFRYEPDGSIHYGVNYNKCIDLPWNEAYDGAPLQIYDCNGTVAQSFQFTN